MSRKKGFEGIKLPRLSWVRWRGQKEEQKRQKNRFYMTVSRMGGFKLAMPCVWAATRVWPTVG